MSDVKILRERSQSSKDRQLEEDPYAMKYVGLSEAYVVHHLRDPDPPNKCEIAHVRQSVFRS
jgi:hypothetical protein